MLTQYFLILLSNQTGVTELLVILLLNWQQRLGLTDDSKTTDSGCKFALSEGVKALSFEGGLLSVNKPTNLLDMFIDV